MLPGMHDELIGIKSGSGAMDGREFRKVRARTNDVKKTHESLGNESRDGNRGASWAFKTRAAVGMPSSRGIT